MQKNVGFVKENKRKKVKRYGKEQYFGKKLMSVFLVFSLILGLFSVPMLENMRIADTVKAAEADQKEGSGDVVLRNPRIEEYQFKENRNVMTWDCIYFGSYPQAEVVPAGEYEAIEREYLQEGDIIVDDELYLSLQNAAGWDENGDLTLDGEKYRRIKKEEVMSVKYTSPDYYHWNDSETYHYFKYEPIKWRIINTDGEKAILLADKVLDGKQYNITGYSVVWEQSTIRSFLNGYDSTENQKNEDYSLKRNFLGTAFDNKDLEVLENIDATGFNLSLDGISNITEENGYLDKIFLLSEEEMEFKSIKDNAGKSSSSTYAKSMGIEFCESSSWWLRTINYDGSMARLVDKNGRTTYSITNDNLGVRPGVVINLKYANVYSNAGIVREDGSTDVGVSTTLENPRVNQYKYIEDGNRQKMTWDCIYFGSYPQSEVVPSGEYSSISYIYLEEEDIIKDDNLYESLKNATDWDAREELILNGEKYRRIRKGNVTGDRNCYKWIDSETYHYFKYEPIKWRILNINGDKALILSDKVLDDQKYHVFESNVTWERSSIRSFLNSYGSEENVSHSDYSKETGTWSFLATAFNKDDISAIEDTTVIQSNSLFNNSQLARGNDTVDKVFLLSDFEVNPFENDQSYFLNNTDYVDSIMSRSSTYAKAMGTYPDDMKRCRWWLRSPGKDSSELSEYTKCAMIVDPKMGWVDTISVNVNLCGVRPAAVINLNNINVYNYAGVVHSDFSTEQGKEVGGKEEHIHDYGVNWMTDESSHWKECECGEKEEESLHIFEWITDKVATVNETGVKHEECSVCGYRRNENTVIEKIPTEHIHSYNSAWKVNQSSHWKECSCGEKAEKADHVFAWVIDKAATINETGVKHEECSICGYKRNENTVIDIIPSEEMKEYSITASTSEGGSIIPSGNIKVKEKESQNFVISISEGYEIKDIFVDGKSIGAVSSYIFQNVTENHEIKVQFSKKIAESVPTKSEVKEVTGLELFEKSKKLVIGEKYILTAKPSPTDADNQAVVYRSSNIKIATVTQNGTITVKGTGTTVITVTSVSNPKVSASCIITVPNPTIKISGKSKIKRGKSVTLTAKVKNFKGTVKWSLDKKSKKFAKLSKSSGSKVKVAVKKSAKKKSTITVTAKAGSVKKKKKIKIS